MCLRQWLFAAFIYIHLTQSPKIGYHFRLLSYLIFLIVLLTIWDSDLSQKNEWKPDDEAFWYWPPLSLSKYNGRQMTAANFSDFFKRNYMVLTYLLDRPAFSTAKAFNLYLFFTGHDIWGSQFIFTSLWLPPAYTKMCQYVTNSNWIFEKSVQPLKHTFQITLYSNF